MPREYIMQTHIQRCHTLNNSFHFIHVFEIENIHQELQLEFHCDHSGTDTKRYGVAFTTFHLVLGVI